MSQMPTSLVYVVSDSVGETADLVVRAAISQFEKKPDVRRFPYVDDAQTIEELVQSAEENRALIAFTLVLPELRDHLIRLAQSLSVPYVDIMGPMMSALEKATQQPPKQMAGLVRRLDEDYYRRIEAIEFAVKYDDGRDPRGIERADVVLIGVSRTSKTPLSMYLAHKRIKVANVPLVPEVEPPEALYHLAPGRCVGLVIEPEQLNVIRTERLKSLGLEFGAQYATLERIREELAYARGIMDRVGCPVVDVTHKAVEETANQVLSILQRSG